MGDWGGPRGAQRKTMKDKKGEEGTKSRKSKKEKMWVGGMGERRSK